MPPVKTFLLLIRKNVGDKGYHLCLVMLSAILWQSSSLAEPILYYRFERNNQFYNAPTYTNTRIDNATSWSSVDSASTPLSGSLGILGIGFRGNRQKISHYAIAGEGGDVNGKGFRFSFNLKDGYSLDLRNFRFNNQIWDKITGPKQWTMLVNGKQVASGDTGYYLDGNGQYIGRLSNPMHVSGKVDIDLLSYGASDPKSVWRVDNFRLAGDLLSPIPVPAPLFLLGFGLAALLGMRRREGGISA